jgi:hypothetical protein
MIFIFIVWLKADGTAEYGQAIRWCYLMGNFGRDPMASRITKRIDNRNFKKWQKINKKDYTAYLDVARV